MEHPPPAKKAKNNQKKLDFVDLSFMLHSNKMLQYKKVNYETNFIKNFKNMTDSAIRQKKI